MVPAHVTLGIHWVMIYIAAMVNYGPMILYYTHQTHFIRHSQTTVILNSAECLSPSTRRSTCVHDVQEGVCAYIV